MTVTINVNGLSLVHRGSGGSSTATLPDVCKTPPNATPVAYPNIAFSTTLADGTVTVRVDGGHSAAVRGSSFAHSSGDEPGTLGGIASSVFTAPACWLTYSFDVRLEGRPASRHTDKMLHNGANTIDCGGVQNPPVASSRLRHPHGAHMPKGHQKIVVQVVDAAGAPVIGATVTIEGPRPKRYARQIHTGHGNEATFSNLPRGSFQITATQCCHSNNSERKPSVPMHDASTRYPIRLDIPNLKQLATDKGVTLYARPDWKDPRNLTTLQNEFHGGIVGFFWQSIEPRRGEPGAGEWAWLNLQTDTHLRNGMQVMGTPLVWSTASSTLTPKWAAHIPGIRGRQKQSVVTDQLRHYLHWVLQAFGSKIRTWVTMNEPLNLLFYKSVRDFPFWRAFGIWDPPFDRRKPHQVPAAAHRIVEVFQITYRELCGLPGPPPLLILNDFDNECWDGVARPISAADSNRLQNEGEHHKDAGGLGHDSRMIRAEQYYRLVRYLVQHLPEAGVPLANFAVGFQMHWPSNAYDVRLFRENLRRYHELGVQVTATELDVTMTGSHRDAYKLFDALSATYQRRIRVSRHRFPHAYRASDRGSTFDLDALLDGYPETVPAFLQFLSEHRGAIDAVYASQATLYGEIWRALLAYPNVRRIMTWGINDAREQFRPFGYLFNNAFGCSSPPGEQHRKPAYYAVCEALRDASRRP